MSTSDDRLCHVTMTTRDAGARRKRFAKGASRVAHGVLGALGACAAMAPAIAAAHPKVVPLYHWYDATTNDNEATSDEAWAGLPGETRSPSYRFMKVDAWIYDPASPRPAGTIPVYGWFSATRGDYFTTTDPRWAGRAGDVREGYRFQRIEGYVHESPVPGTKALRSFWSPTRADNFVTADIAWVMPLGTARDGYTHYRIEGYAFPGDARADLKRFATVGLPTASGTPGLFRHQGGTRRCQAFAVTAAIEAAYAHTGLEVDLSEQLAGVTSKLLSLNLEASRTATEPENQLGLFDGGGGAGWLKQLEDGQRVAEENVAMPFLDGLAGITDLAGNPPPWPPPPAAQKLWNDFNLGPIWRTTDGVRRSFRTLPQTMLTQARYYGVSGARLLCDGTCPSMAASTYEAALRDGHEVVIDAYGGDHVMLMMGYDRIDPANPYFIVKNSYGAETGNEDGFLKYPYSEIRNVVGAGYIESVRPVAKWNEARFFGRWNLSLDGHKGTLDIYHLPGTAKYQIGKQYGITAADRRLGTFRDTAGNMFRVNGSIVGDKIVFYFDGARPALPWDSLSGRRFEYTLSGDDVETMAGTHRDPDGHVFGGYARKAGHVYGVPGGDGSPYSELSGTWEVLADGRRDRLVMNADRTGIADYRLHGRYEIEGGTYFTFSMWAPSGVFTIPLGTGRSLTVGLLNHQPGVLAGTLAEPLGATSVVTGVVGRRLGS